MNDVYDVILETPVGKRYGEMAVSIQDKNVTGILHILKGAEPFEGEIEHSGHCRISGNLSTLMRRIPYLATGIIGESIELELISGKGHFQLVGKQKA